MDSKLEHLHPYNTLISAHNHSPRGIKTQSKSLVLRSTHFLDKNSTQQAQILGPNERYNRYMQILQSTVKLNCGITLQTKQYHCSEPRAQMFNRTRGTITNSRVIRKAYQI